MEEMQRTDGRWDATQFSCLGESPNFSKEDFRKEREWQKKNQEERVYVGEVGAGDVDTAGFLPLVSSFDSFRLLWWARAWRKQTLSPGSMWSCKKKRTCSQAMITSWWRETIEGLHKLLKFERNGGSLGQPKEEGDVQAASCALPHYTPKRALSLPAFPSLPQLPSLAVPLLPRFCLPQNSVSLPIPKQMLSKTKLKPGVRATGCLVWRKAACQGGQRAGEVEGPGVWVRTHFMPHLLRCHRVSEHLCLPWMYASCFHFLSKGPKILVFISSGVCLLLLFIFEDRDNLLYIFLTASRSLDSKGSGPPFFSVSVQY